MPTSFDSLQIDINANATRANDAVDRLIAKLGMLSTSLSKVNGSNLNGLANGVQRLGTAMQTMNTVKTADFTRLANGIQRLSNIQSGNMSQSGNALKVLANGLGALSGASFDGRNINNLLSGLSRLANANLSGLGNVNFSALGQSINQLTSSLANAPRVQQSVIQMTNAIASLAGAGANIPLVSGSLSQLGVSLRNFMQAMAGAPTVSANTIAFTQALGSLASAGSRAGSVANNLGSLSVALRNAMQTLSTAPTVSQNLIQMTNALGRLSSSGIRAGKTMNSTGKSFNLFSRHATTATKKSFSLASAIGKVYASYWMLFRAFRYLKKAIDISSGLTEVQNVVDVTFGNAADKLNEFASTSIQTLGMSELTTKQIASRYQAMGTAMGISTDKMADMSIELTKLAGDMASFYNVSQKDVGEDLESIFTGMTRPLMLAA